MAPARALADELSVLIGVGRTHRQRIAGSPPAARQALARPNVLAEALRAAR